MDKKEIQNSFWERWLDFSFWERWLDLDEIDRNKALENLIGVSRDVSVSAISPSIMQSYLEDFETIVRARATADQKTLDIGKLKKQQDAYSKETCYYQAFDKSISALKEVD